MSEIERVKETHLVTGGGGYPGFSLAQGLLAQGHRVKIIDMIPPQQTLSEGLSFEKVDISDYIRVLECMDGVDCVYHMASYGMSGRDQLNKTRIEQVNVTGTENVIKACMDQGVRRLVYTSTYNVVFGGEEIRNGDESLPYFPLHKQPDHYSRTKSLAEQMILRSDDSEVRGGGRLRTCALRLAGVYGPGEQRHLPRIMDYVRRGLFSFTYGHSDTLVEFLHVENLVQAHIKAGRALHGSHPIAAGQAYFISDCKPINNFLFFKPMIEDLGYRYPSVCLPVSLIYMFAVLTELIHYIVGRIYNFQPLLTRTEVYKTGVTHYFSNAKACRDLGYSPTVQNDLTGVVRWFKENGYAKNISHNGDQTIRSVLINIILVMLICAVLLSFLPNVR